MLPVSLRPTAESVIASHHVQGGEEDARSAPAAVFPEAVKGGHAALTFQFEVGLPQGPVGGIEDLAEEGQALQGIGRRFRFVAVGPFVVAGDEDEGMPEAVELLQAVPVDVVAAGIVLSLEVAHVDHKGQVLPVHGVYEVFELRFLHRCVGQVSDDAEGPFGRRLRASAGGGACQEQARGENQQYARSHVEIPFGAVRKARSFIQPSWIPNPLVPGTDSVPPRYTGLNRLLD